MSWFGDNNSHWDPGNWSSVGDVPVIGDIHKGIWGDPKAIKEAYDKAINDATVGGQNITNFLLGQQAKAQQYYAPLQHMFNSAYGTEGLQAPQKPPATALTSLFGSR